MQEIRQRCDVRSLCPVCHICQAAPTLARCRAIRRSWPRSAHRLAHSLDQRPCRTLGRLAIEKMLAGSSSRRYGHGLEPAGTQVEQAAVSMSKSAVSRRLMAAAETALAQLMSRRLDDLDLGRVHGRWGALRRAHMRRRARHRHRRRQAPAGDRGGLDGERSGHACDVECVDGGTHDMMWTIRHLCALRTYYARNT